MAQLEALPRWCVKVLSALDDDQVSRSIDAPCQGRGGHQNLDLAGYKEALTSGPVCVCQASMVHANSKLQRVSQVRVLQ